MDRPIPHLIWRHVTLKAIAISLASIAALAALAASGRVRLKRVSSPTPPVVAAIGKPQSAEKGSAVTSFAAPEFRAAFESVSASNGSGRQTITMKVLNTGTERIQAVQVLLVDFAPEGAVSRVEQHRLPLAVLPGSNQMTSFLCDLGHDPAHTRTLALLSVHGQTNRQQVDIRQLISALALPPTKAAAADLGLTEVATEQATFTPDVCYQSMSLAHELASSLGLTATGNLCDRYRQSFAISFSAAAQQ